MPTSPERVTDKKAIADVLDQMATLLELTGANPFKSRAFRNAAPVINALPDDIEEHVRNGTLRTIKGIGEGISRVITDLVQEGCSNDHQELLASVPRGLLEMTSLRGLGPKRVLILYKKLEISTMEELENACKAGKVAKLEGFGEKSEKAILTSIEQAQTYSDQHLYPTGRRTADALLEALRPLALKDKCEVAGSLRRKKEIIRDIDIVAAAPKSAHAKLMRAFVKHTLVSSVIAEGETKSTIRTKDGILCDLRVVSADEFPYALNYFTGSKEHNIAVRSLARKKGWSLNEYGFTPAEAKPKKKVPSCATEEEIYRSLGLTFIEPELRENLGEVEAAATTSLPALVRVDDLRGTFHCHTTYSDGSNSLRDMAEAAKKKGWEYWGVADHSQVAAYARGLTHDRVLEQHKEVDALQKSMKGFRIFKGTECDILGDGSLDFPARTLSLFEYVVISIHSKFSMTEAEATKRVIKALKNKYTTILGHSTGRLLLQRDGYPLDLRQVIDAASDYGKAIEINAHPMRLDLDWRWLRYAKDKKVPIAINPDAHAIQGLDDVAYGIGIARKGWLEPKDIVNTWPTARVEAFFERVRK